MANYLVTGAAGFIGSRVAEMLLHDGHDVTGIDNLNNAYDVRMKHWRLQELTKHPEFSFRELDIGARQFFENKKSFIEEDKSQFDAVINLAARAGVRQSLIDPWEYIHTNVTGTLNLLELCRNLGINKFILASTSSIYGADAPQPTPEDANSDHPLQPYAASKKGAEALCHSYHFLYGIDVTVFRYFTVYGPAGRPDMSMFRFIQWLSEGRPVKLFGDGEQTRGFTYIDDIARGTILGLNTIGYEVINLGGHETIKIIDLIHNLEELISQKAFIEKKPVHPADMLANWADVGKAHSIIGWQPQVTLEKGIAKTVTWYQEQRSWASHIETI